MSERSEKERLPRSSAALRLCGFAVKIGDSRVRKASFIVWSDSP